MTEQEYNNREGIRRSDLWLIHDSPEKFRETMDNSEKKDPTPALIFGSAAHKILLEPNDFAEEFAIAPDGIDKRTKEGKAHWAMFLESNAGKTIIDRDTFNQILAMSEKAMSNPKVAELLNGRKEVPFFWTDPDTGVKLKVKLDCLHYSDDEPIIVDYKTARSARTEKFMRDVYDLGYHVQAAMYTEGVMRNLNLTKRPKFKFIVQEKEPPFAVNLITVPDDVMAYGLDTMRELLGIYHECDETGIWWGYNGPFDEENELTLPAWMVRDLESEN